MSQAAVRNLLILHTPTAQALSDWEEVKHRIETRAPDIEVRIANNLSRNFVTRRWQVSRPSLVFSVAPLRAYQPAGGKVYAGRRLVELGKAEELHRMRVAGLPVPPTVPLTPDLRLCGEPWGEFVVVKPAAGWRGMMVRLVRIEDLSRRYAELTANGQVPMLVQPYIHHVDAEGRPADYRVTTLFGREVLAGYKFWNKPQRPLADLAADADGIIAVNDTTVEKSRRLIYEEDVIALGRSVHRFAQDFEESGGSTRARHKEWHWSADFMVGRDIGLGGQPGQVKIGVRIADLRAATKVVSSAFESFGSLTFSSAFTQRSRFFGVGPRAAIEGSVLLQGPWSIDYGAGVAVLYGNRKLDVNGTFGGGPFNDTSSSSSWVPNVDASIALSYLVTPQFKVSVGYQLDAYWNVLRTFNSSGNFTHIDRYFHGAFLRGTGRF